MPLKLIAATATSSRRSSDWRPHRSLWHFRHVRDRGLLRDPASPIIAFHLAKISPGDRGPCAPAITLGPAYTGSHAQLVHRHAPTLTRYLPDHGTVKTEGYLRDDDENLFANQFVNVDLLLAPSGVRRA